MIVARQSTHDPNRWFMNFDAAAPGGLGGCSLLLDPARQLISIDSVHKNRLLPRRSTGRLVASGIVQAGMPNPIILGAYFVEETSEAKLASGSDGSDTLMGKFLQRVADALGGEVVRWEPIPLGHGYHLWVHVEYP